ncbi:MAG: hypothetical protein ABUL44_00390 [Flavobacterium sp.]
MKKLLIIFVGIITASITSFAQKKAACTEDCCKKTKETVFTCKLTSAEFRERKATVIASLKKQVLEKKELKNGFAYKFAGNDNTVDEITNFIKTERQCCSFFKFNMSINGDSETWLEITGPKGAKDVIINELEL